MKTYRHHIVSAIAVALVAMLTITACGKGEEPLDTASSNKTERNHIRAGNKLFEDKEFADAEVEYGKALQANPQSATAAYNMGLAITRQASQGDTTGMLQRADSLFNFAAQVSHDKNLKMMAHYNMGNIAYNAQNYARAIECYKNALRAVPGDEDSRYNLRMAQLKLQDQQQQQQDNKDQDKDKQDQDKNQNQDQNQNQKDQNQDQDKQDQDKQNDGGNQDKGNEQQAGQDNADKAQAKEQPGQPMNMDERSIGQVLKAMQDKEKETQQKIYQMSQGQQQRERQATRNKW